MRERNVFFIWIIVLSVVLLEVYYLVWSLNSVLGLKDEYLKGGRNSKVKDLKYEEVRKF